MVNDTKVYGPLSKRWLIVMFLMLVVTPSTLQAARIVAEKRECATCHIAWMADFKKEDVITLIPHEPRPIVETGKQDVVSTERMCFSCHDGFALDSRPKWLEGRHSHPVGVVPSDRVEIPKRDDKTIFPLNDDGKIYCGTCHSAHGLSWQESDSPIFLRIPNVDSSICIACHKNKQNQIEGVNHPVMRKLDDPPKALASVGGRFGEGGEIICESCHMPHAARSSPLLVTSSQQAQLCGYCHENKIGILNTKHDLTRSAPHEVNRKGEKVSEYGPCMACHVLHGADTSAPLWGRGTGKGEFSTEAICKDCHSKGGPADKKRIGPHSHPVNVAITKLGINPKEKGWRSRATGKPLDAVPLPLFDKSGKRDPSGRIVSCLTCHDPHAWSVRKTQGDSKADKEGDGSTSFLRIPQDRGSALCLNCHREKRSILNSDHGLSLAGKVRKQQKRRESLQTGVCSNCHLAHNGSGALMSPTATDSAKGAIQSICIRCHGADGLAKEKQTGTHSHPVHVGVRKVGGKTSLPLFDKRGNRSAKGTVECGTCHDPHKWGGSGSGRKLEQKEGDASTSFLRLPAAPNPKLCLDCHRDKRPVLGTDHDVRIGKSKAGVDTEREAERVGVCGYCHNVHNAQSKLALWAREGGEGKDPRADLCRSCHSKDGPAESKVPVKDSHPPQVLIWSNQVRGVDPKRRRLPVVPVFNQRGSRAAVGKFSCASCHDPHVWSSDKPKPGNGRNQEGDATTSFLRNASSGYIVCADCHGGDAIYRYKYFHAKKSRKPHPLYR